MKDFAGRVAVITGGASGIGFATARALGRRGMKLVIADIEAGALERATAALAAEGFAVAGKTTDVGDRAALNELADFAWERFGGAHLVMHNAGVAVFGPTQEMTEQDWEWSLRVNLYGPIHGVQAFLPRMIAQAQGGHMVFTASFAGLVPNRDLGVYNVTKAAVVALAESVAKDAREHHIGASVLCPMRVESAIDQSYRNRPESLGGPTANRSYTAEELAQLHGRALPTEPVGELVAAAVERGDLYIHTHKEAQAFIAKRAERIQASFAHAL
jgi:NAD(P)-dependent dehydrogenase (short-subunit alcohol dehydrogenase family)